MLIYLNNKIYDTDEAEVTDEAERPEHGYFNEAIEYKAQDGEHFCVKRSKFSNICDSIWAGKLENYQDYDSESLPHYFDFKGTKNPNNEWDIENLKEQIADAKDEEEIEELKKELIELEAEQEEYDNILPEIAEEEEILDFDNIGMGASSTKDFNYQSYVVYRNGDDYFMKNRTCENGYIGEVSEAEVINLAAWANKMWGYKTGLEYIVEHLEDFGWVEAYPGVYEEELGD